MADAARNKCLDGDSHDYHPCQCATYHLLLKQMAPSPHMHCYMAANPQHFHRLVVKCVADNVQDRLHLLFDVVSNEVCNAWQAASAAAQQAQAAAEASAVQAGQAQQAAQGAARALLASKRAEIEAADMLEKPKNPKEADPGAADLLKVSHALAYSPWHSHTASLVVNC